MPSGLVDIVHCVEFSAAHRLFNRQLSDVENEDLFGPCDHIHGHNYRLEVAVRGPVDPRTGMVMNLDHLAAAVREEIFEKVDHRFLNEDVPFLAHLEVVTAEALVATFWDVLQARAESWGTAMLYRLRLMESEINFVEYYGPA